MGVGPAGFPSAVAVAEAEASATLGSGTALELAVGGAMAVETFVLGVAVATGSPADALGGGEVVQATQVMAASNARSGRSEIFMNLAAQYQTTEDAAGMIRGSAA